MAFLNHGWKRINTDFFSIDTYRASTTLSALFLLLSLLLFGPARTDAGTLQNLGNGICLDRSTGLMWQIGHSRRFGNRDKVEQYLTALRLGGYSDWRLPTILESKGLRLLIDIHGNAACGIEKPMARYWMVDPNKGMLPVRLELESFCRGIYSRSVGKRGYVRAVRTKTE
jgi:hypothetical protein